MANPIVFSNHITTLILGAGASQPYGFPLGKDLKNKIIESCNIMLRISDISAEIRRDVEKFLEAYTYSDITTIDEFVEKKGYERLAKVLIYDALKRHEDKNRLFKQQNCWYSLLRDYLDLIPKDTIAPHNTKIITLNYDRSLEFFLQGYIDYTVDDDFKLQAQENLKNLEIHHLHGSPGSIMNTEYSPSGIPFAVKGAASDMYNMTDHIQILNNKTKIFKHYSKAKEILNKTEILIFLGFGYHSHIMKELFNGVDMSKFSLYCCAHGLNDAEVRKSFDRTARFSKIGGGDADCLHFLREIELLYGTGKQ